ncbi:hypothetical protein [Intrasporangium mesophilum]
MRHSTPTPPIALRATVTVPVTAPSGLATLSARSVDNVIMTVTPR